MPAKKLGYGHGVGHLDGGNSGRFPWGSGEHPFQHATDFIGNYNRLRAEGMSQKDIATGFGMSINELRAAMSIAKENKYVSDVARAQELLEKGYTKTAIAKELGLANESTLRDMLKPERLENKGATAVVADKIREAVDKKGFVDVGVGNEHALNVTETTLNYAIERLKLEGYEYYNNIKVMQLGTNKLTTMKILAKPGTTWKEAYDKRLEVESIADYDTGSKNTTLNIKKPVDLDSKRIFVRYAEEGGEDKDGVVELRRGVDDISLGKSSYAQVRIAVDGTHYIKGMAMYSDDIPKGYDVLINSNKSKGTPLMTESGEGCVLKKMKKDPDNPFGATISAQSGVINKIREEGEWSTWSKTVSSQMLGKQPLKLISNQLDLTYSQMEAEFDKIKNLTNPTVKRNLLRSFADECDAAAVELKATAFPRQSQCVLLPVTSLKNNEIYAPQYKDGETVALIRYPHGGLFEIPILKVNNKNKEGKNNIGKPIDAVGISPAVASVLSGADFDGDTATVIPCNGRGSKIKIESQPRLKDLEGFDPKKAYPTREGMSVMKKGSQTQREMGMISNLITDMTLKGAKEDELARAVKHSMVVIDAAKHKLDYKLSEKENKIDELRKYYQQQDTDGKYGGASTLLSKAKQTVRIDERSTRPPSINPTTGEKIFKYTGRTYVDPKTGETKKATEESTLMYETKDARQLSSGTNKEALYAKYANNAKALGDKARLELLNTGLLTYSPTANKAYAAEVESLNNKLSRSLMNAPRERQAMRVANAVVNTKIEENGLNRTTDKEDIKKLKNQALAAARERYGAKKYKIEITDKEWEAIQAGAIHDSKLDKILTNTDLDVIKEYATPKDYNTKINASKIRLIKSYAKSYTQEEIAKMLGLSVSTVAKYAKEA